MRACGLCRHRHTHTRALLLRRACVRAWSSALQLGPAVSGLAVTWPPAPAVPAAAPSAVACHPAVPTVLLLHGWGQTPALLLARAGGLLRKLQRVARVVLPAGPHLLPPLRDDDDVDTASPRVAQAAAAAGTAAGPRAWFLYHRDDPSSIDGFLLPVPRAYFGVESALRELRAVERVHGAASVVMGFSQGAVMAHALCAMSGSGRGLESLRGAVFFGGFPCRDPQLCGTDAAPLALPSLHVIGEGPSRAPPSPALLVPHASPARRSGYPRPRGAAARAGAPLPAPARPRGGHHARAAAARGRRRSGR